MILTVAYKEPRDNEPVAASYEADAINVYRDRIAVVNRIPRPAEFIMLAAIDDIYTDDPLLRSVFASMHMEGKI